MSGAVYLTFASEFNAIHKLWNAKLSDAANAQMFGECANPSGHGHRYRIEITVAAEVDARRPVAIERRSIKDLVETVLGPRLNHGNLDTAFGGENFISTGENVARAIWQLVEPALADDAKLVRVKVIETPKNSFAYFGKARRRAAAVPM